jgi:hypothetical protein
MDRHTIVVFLNHGDCLALAKAHVLLLTNWGRVIGLEMYTSSSSFASLAVNEAVCRRHKTGSRVYQHCLFWLFLLQEWQHGLKQIWFRWLVSESSTLLVHTTGPYMAFRPINCEFHATHYREITRTNLRDCGGFRSMSLQEKKSLTSADCEM